jgi:hypothetical protein
MKNYNYNFKKFLIHLTYASRSSNKNSVGVLNASVKGKSFDFVQIIYGLRALHRHRDCLKMRNPSILLTGYAQI